MTVQEGWLDGANQNPCVSGSEKWSAVCYGNETVPTREHGLYDCMYERVTGGRWFRILTVVDSSPVDVSAYLQISPLSGYKVTRAQGRLCITMTCRIPSWIITAVHIAGPDGYVGLLPRRFERTSFEPASWSKIDIHVDSTHNPNTGILF